MAKSLKVAKSRVRVLCLPIGHIQNLVKCFINLFKLVEYPSFKCIRANFSCQTPIQLGEPKTSKKIDEQTGLREVCLSKAKMWKFGKSFPPNPTVEQGFHDTFTLSKRKFRKRNGPELAFIESRENFLVGKPILEGLGMRFRTFMI